MNLMAGSLSAVGGFACEVVKLVKRVIRFSSIFQGALP